MNRICINGVFFADFGDNNYSYGMHLVSTCAAITTEQVLAGEFPGVYLNPSAPWNELEAFCVLGTPEQYAEFYETQREAQISKRLCEQGGLDLPINAYRELRDQIESEYKDWWENE
jgi:hypothetical protein